MATKSKKKKIRYGKANLLTEEDFAPENIKERITIWINMAVVDKFRERAKLEGTKYQTLINQALLEYINKPSLEERIERIEKRMRVG